MVNQMMSASRTILLALSCLHSTEALQKDLHISPLQLPPAKGHLEEKPGIPDVFEVGDIRNSSDDFLERPIFNPLEDQGAIEITINTAQDATSFLVSVAVNSFALVVLLVVFSIVRYFHQPLYRREHCYICATSTQNFCPRSFLTVCEECVATGAHAGRSPIDFDEVQATRCGCCDSPCMGWLSRVYNLQPEDEIDVAGLDAWTLLQVIRLNCQIWMVLGPVLLLVLGSLHFSSCQRHEHRDFTDSGSNADILGCLDVGTIPTDSWVWWVHVAMVWIVVFVVTYMMGRAHDDFLNRRFRWLKAIPPPRSTTVMVENIPPSTRSDEALLEYFKDVFEGKGIEVLDAYIVRRTPVLRERVERLSNLQYHKKIKQSAGKEWPTEMQTAETEAIEAVKEEQMKVEAAAATRDADEAETYCSSSGFVTFSTMIAQRLAERQQYTRDTTEFIVTMPPDPGDVRYSDLAQGEIGAIWEYLGSLSLVALFLLWSPVVIFISGFANLEKIALHSTAVADFIRVMPAVTTLLQGLLSSAALRLFMAFLPNILFTIISCFYTLKAGAWAQFQLEKWYFAFLVMFVLLGPALGRSLIATALQLIDHPSDALHLLATSLPTASHFFMNYIVVGWTAAVFELLRVANLTKYLWFRVRGLSIEEAKSFAEPEDAPAYGMGARMATMVLTSVITLVFCTVSPIITILSAVYFALCRMVYSQQMIFAECRKADLGGTFWVEALQQMYFGLVVFILLMTGVLIVNTEQIILPIIAFFAVVPLLFKYLRLRSLAWELLPLEQVAEATRDLDVDAVLKSGFYRQPECDPEITKRRDVRRSLITQPSKLTLDEGGSGTFHRQPSPSSEVSPARGFQARVGNKGVPGG